MTPPGILLRSARTLVLASALALGAAAGAAEVGSVRIASGVVTAQSVSGATRVLAKGAKLEEGDVLSTATRSFAVLEMGDGSRMTIRPRTVLALQEYKFEAQKESAVLRLFRGGLRAITGFISKRNDKAFQIRTSVATIGIRGTAFEARICDAACSVERAKLRARRGGAAATPPRGAGSVVARMVFVRGQVQADRGAGRPRPLSLGGSLYEGDTIETARGALAVISFKDGSRVTVVAGSSFKIEQMNFEPRAPRRDGMILRLLRGGLRAVTGLMGQRNPGRVGLRAGTATIGIRGTGLDLACDGPCGNADDAVAARRAPLGPVERPIAWLLDGMVQPAWAADGRVFVHFFSGSGTLTSGGRAIDVPTGGTALVPALGAVPQPFAGRVPQIMRSVQDAPNPGNDAESVDPEMQPQLDQLFDVGESGELTEGSLIVLVDEGDVQVGGVFLGAGEGVVAGGSSRGFVRVINSEVQIVRLPAPSVLEQNAGLLENLGFGLNIELNDSGQMCIGF